MNYLELFCLEITVGGNREVDDWLENCDIIHQFHFNLSNAVAVYKHL